MEYPLVGAVAVDGSAVANIPPEGRKGRPEALPPGLMPLFSPFFRFSPLGPSGSQFNRHPLPALR